MARATQTRKPSLFGPGFQQQVIDLLNHSSKASVIELEAIVKGNWHIDAILEARGIAGWPSGITALEVKYAKTYIEVERYVHGLAKQLTPDIKLRDDLQYILLITNYVLSDADKAKVDALKNMVFQTVAKTGTKLKDFAIIDGRALVDLANDVSAEMGEKIAGYTMPRIKQDTAKIEETTSYSQTTVINRPDLKVSIAVTGKGWEIPADAFVLPIGDGPSFEGQIFSQIEKTYDPYTWQNLIKKAYVEAPNPFDIDTPFIVEQGGGQAIAAPNIIFATAYRFDGVIPYDACLEVCKLIDQYKYETIVFPLIGGQRIGAPNTLAQMFKVFFSIKLSRSVHIIIPVLDPALIDVARDNIPEEDRGYEEPVYDRVLVPDTVRLKNDTLDNEDCLETEKQADVFARLLMAENVSMPLAIGLFGKWGSGKSFFMKKIREKSKKLVPDQKDKDAPVVEGSPYVARPIHIEFNAWHYIDADLWASLVSHIYDEILRQVGEENSPKLKAKEALKEIQKAADKKLNDATNTVQQLTEDIHRLNNALADAQQKNNLQLERIFQSAALSKIKKELVGFGVDEKYFNSLEDLAQISKGLQEIISGLDPFLPNVLKKNIWSRIVGYVLLIAVPAGLFAAVNSVFHDPNSELKSLVISLLTTASASAVYIKGCVGKIKKHVKSAAEVYSLVKDEIKRKSPQAAEIDKLLIQIEAQKKALALAEKEVVNASQEKVRAAQGGLVYDFILERRKDPCYQDNLGIVSVIRKDFEDLKARLTVSSEAGDKKGRALVDRIILYIDDLDRCEPDRVVEVLQAVHLLLAFDLFAVVVAVDDRWLERALYDRYVPNWLDLTEKQLRDCDFEPHNYLEKIFQIPFHVADMDQTGYARLVDNLTADLLRKEEVIGSAKKQDFRQIWQDDDIEEPHEVVVPNSPDVKGDGERDFTVNEKDIVKSFELEAHEIEFLKALSGFARTPRTTKRLINLYILLRVQAATKGADEVSKFSDKERGEYRAAALLLALVVEKPSLLDVFANQFDSNRYAHMLTDNLMQALTQAVDNRVNIDDLQNQHGKIPDWGIFEKWLPEVKRFSFPWKRNGVEDNSQDL